MAKHECDVCGFVGDESFKIQETHEILNVCKVCYDGYMVRLDEQIDGGEAIISVTKKSDADIEREAFEAYKKLKKRHKPKPIRQANNTAIGSSDEFAYSEIVDNAGSTHLVDSVSSTAIVDNASNSTQLGQEWDIDDYDEYSALDPRIKETILKRLAIDDLETNDVRTELALSKLMSIYSGDRHNAQDDETVALSSEGKDYTYDNLDSDTTGTDDSNDIDNGSDIDSVDDTDHTSATKDTNTTDVAQVVSDVVDNVSGVVDNVREIVDNDSILDIAEGERSAVDTIDNTATTIDNTADVAQVVSAVVDNVSGVVGNNREIVDNDSILDIAEGEPSTVAAIDNTATTIDNTADVAQVVSDVVDNVSGVVDNDSILDIAKDERSAVDTIDNTATTLDNTTDVAQVVSAVVDNVSGVVDNVREIVDNDSILDIAEGEPSTVAAIDNTATTLDNTTDVAQVVSDVVDKDIVLDNLNNVLDNNTTITSTQDKVAHDTISTQYKVSANDANPSHNDKPLDTAELAIESHNSKGRGLFLRLLPKVYACKIWIAIGLALCIGAIVYDKVVYSVGVDARAILLSLASVAILTVVVLCMQRLYKADVVAYSSHIAQGQGDIDNIAIPSNILNDSRHRYHLCSRLSRVFGVLASVVPLIVLLATIAIGYYVVVDVDITVVYRWIIYPIFVAGGAVACLVAYIILRLISERLRICIDSSTKHDIIIYILSNKNKQED